MELDLFVKRAEYFAKHKDNPYQIIRILLDSARDNVQITRAGDLIKVIRASSDDANIDIRFNMVDAPLLNFKRYRKVETYFQNIYISNDAQAGEWVDVLIAVKQWFDIADVFAGGSSSMTGERTETANTFINAVTFNNIVTTYTSAAFDAAIYYYGLLEIALTVANVPTDILLELEFSDDGVTWYKYMRDAWGDFRYEDTACPNNECFDFPVRAKYVRLKATATGTDAVNTFTLTAKGVFSR